MSSAEDQLLDWVRQQRRAVVAVRFSGGSGGIPRGLVAAQDTAAGGLLLSCPARMALPLPYTDSAFAAPLLLREVLTWRRCQQPPSPRAQGLSQGQGSPAPPAHGPACLPDLERGLQQLAVSPRLVGDMAGTARAAAGGKGGGGKEGGGDRDRVAQPQEGVGGAQPGGYMQQWCHQGLRPPGSCPPGCTCTAPGTGCGASQQGAAPEAPTPDPSERPTPPQAEQRGGGSSLQPCWPGPRQPYVATLPGPHQLLTGYNFPLAALPLLACPDLECVVRVLKGRARRVFATGHLAQAAATSPPAAAAGVTRGAAQAGAACRGAPFPLTLAAAEAAPCCCCWPRSVDGASPSRASRGPAGGGGEGGPGAPAQVASLEDVEWAAALLCSRSIQSSLPGTMVLLPLMDMVNHSGARPSAAMMSSSDSSSASDTSDSGSNSLDSDGGQGKRQQPPSTPPGCLARPCGAPRQAAARYRRRNKAVALRPLRAGEELLFRYHSGLRDDEALLYYGFMDPAHAQAPALCAVDHPAYRAMRPDPDDQDLYDDTGSQLLVDPLDGPWRGSSRALQGTAHQVRREVQRLQDRLDQAQRAEAELASTAAAPLADPELGQAVHQRPWLLPLLAEFRRRRRTALYNEVQRLKGMLTK